MITIENIKDYTGGVDKAIEFYHKAWGNDKNYNFFYDAMKNSSNNKTGLPRFYVLIKNNSIIGCCGLIMNDFISRHDLFPWIAGVFISEQERGNEYAKFMMNHVEHEAKTAGFNKLFLTTDHDGLYEKYQWVRIEDGFDLQGKPTRIYTKQI